MAPAAAHPKSHRVFELSPGVFVVFKPEGHAEPAHVHPGPQRLHLLTGRLRVTLGRRTIELAPGDSFTIPSRRRHSTLAIEAGWLLATRDLSRLEA